MNTQELVSRAREFGADLVGVAPLERWKDLPASGNPAAIMPACKAVVVLGRRILRGSFRGVEEGTNFGSTYAMFGNVWQLGLFLLRTAHQLVSEIESAGYEAMPLLTNEMQAGEAVDLTGKGQCGNVILDEKLLAHLAGLGAVGKGGFFLTREYGHRQRFIPILTDMPLEATGEIIDPDFCRTCGGACLTACPLGALKDTGASEFVRADSLCAVCRNGTGYIGGNATEKVDRMAASCGRACLVALEKRLGEQFSSPFRKRAVWERDALGKVSLRDNSKEGAK